MTPVTLLRFVAVIAAGLAGVHVAVWGMAAVLTDLGEVSVLNWSAWWTAEGWRTSVILQTRVAAVVGLFGVVIRTFVFGVSRRAVPWLGTASMFFAVLVEVALMPTLGLGPGRGEISHLLGSFAPTGLTIGSAMAASRWMEYSIERRFSIAGLATPRPR